jgi:hypothetical protein
MKPAAENCLFQGAYMRMFDLIDESSRLYGESFLPMWKAIG